MVKEHSRRVEMCNNYLQNNGTENVNVETEIIESMMFLYRACFV